MVRDLESVFVVPAGPVRRTFHIVELDFIDAGLRVHVRREADLKEPVKLLPVHCGPEFDAFGVCRKDDLLRER